MTFFTKLSSPNREVQHNPLVQQATSALPAQGSAVPETSSARGTSPHSTTTTRTTAESKSTSSPRLDLNTVRVSLVIALAGYSMMATAKTGTLFTVYSMLDSLSAGYMPSVQSLALAIYASRGGEGTGTLFGGLSLVQAFGYSSIQLRCEYVSDHLGLQEFYHLSGAFRVHLLPDRRDLPSGNIRLGSLNHRTGSSLHSFY